MRVIDASYEILNRRSLNTEQKIEMAARTAYKSENKIGEDSAGALLETLLAKKHMPTFEFANVHTLFEFRMSYDEFTELMEEFTSDCSLLKYVAISTSEDSTDGLHVLVISGTVRALLDLVVACFKSSILNPIILSLAFLLLKAKDVFPLGFLDEEGQEKLEQDQDPRITPYVVAIGTLQKMMSSSRETLERHAMIAVRFICNRAVSHELVRHRPVSILQESQRYCRYSLDKFGNEVTFIRPKAFFDCPEDFPDSPEFDTKYSAYYIWQESCLKAEKAYLELLSEGHSPQAARTVLPNSCKTELILYATVEEWRHICDMRVSPAAEPSMRELTVPLFEELFNDEHMDKWE